VQNQNNTQAMTELDGPSEPVEAPRFPWIAEAEELLTRAAELCVEHGLDADSFMRGAWAAYVEAWPGMREQIEEMQLRDQLAELRKHGRMGNA
jgi:hypothetical protein